MWESLEVVFQGIIFNSKFNAGYTRLFNCNLTINHITIPRQDVKFESNKIIFLFKDLQTPHKKMFQKDSKWH